MLDNFFVGLSYHMNTVRYCIFCISQHSHMYIKCILTYRTYIYIVDMGERDIYCILYVQFVFNLYPQILKL